MSRRDPTPGAGEAFDRLAADYDAEFTDTRLGRLLRQRVWEYVDPLVRPGTRVLELNCGTGADAVHLAGLGAEVLATDVAPAMLAAARAKAHAAGVTNRVTTAPLAIEALGTLEAEPFDLVLSNFGGINCVADPTPLGPALARLVRPGGSIVLVAMGPTVPWEWAWFLAKREPRRAFRRLSRRVEWRGVAVRYPSLGTLRRMLAPPLVAHRAVPIGVVLPPPYAEQWITSRPQWLRRLDRWDRRLTAAPGAARLADHYLLHLTRP